MHFKKTELSNGIRVISELHPQSRAVSLGVWVLTGTRDEQPDEAGISHFLEHLVFKGTRTRSAYQLAKSLEALGGDLNAYTTREYTVYHCLVLKDHWRKGLEVLSDLVSNMSLSRDDFELEKSVVLQEIAMDEDNLEEIIYDFYLEKTLPKSPLGKPILGNNKSVSQMTMKQVINYYKTKYSGNNIIVAGTGCIDHQDLVLAVGDLLGNKKKQKIHRDELRPAHKPVRAVAEKSSEQLHLLMGFPCSSYRDRMRFEAFIVNALLGGGMTSKLYQSVREKKGLAYSIYSSLNTFVDFGCVNIYAACEKKNMKKVFDSVVTEVKRLRRQRVSDHDLELFKTQVKGAILLGADDVDNRMTSIAVNEIVFGKYKPIETVVEEIDSVSLKSINQFIEKYVRPDQVAAVLMGGGARDLESWIKEAEIA
jgi:predicted Zn-dependent peptidase